MGEEVFEHVRAGRPMKVNVAGHRVSFVVASGFHRVASATPRVIGRPPGGGRGMILDDFRIVELMPTDYRTGRSPERVLSERDLDVAEHLSTVAHLRDDRQHTGHRQAAPVDRDEFPAQCHEASAFCVDASA